MYPFTPSLALEYAHWSDERFGMYVCVFSTRSRIPWFLEVPNLAAQDNLQGYGMDTDEYLCVWTTFYHSNFSTIVANDVMLSQQLRAWSIMHPKCSSCRCNAFCWCVFRWGVFYFYLSFKCCGHVCPITWSQHKQDAFSARRITFVLLLCVLLLRRKMGMKCI